MPTTTKRNRRMQDRAAQRLAERNRRYYHQHKAEFLRKYRDKYFAIHNEQVIGVDATRSGLLNRMFREYGYSRTTRPAPILPVDIISPIHGRKRRVKFRVDTGADMSIVPGTLIPHLGTRAFSEVLVADDDGRRMLYKAHAVHLKHNGRIFENIEVVAPETDTAYLGLDILNRLKFRLDGPGKQLVVH